MIIARIIGGLGNQMFQYAAARAVAYRNNTNLKLDISSFKDYDLRTYRLGCFAIIEDFAGDKDIKIFKPHIKQMISYTDNSIRKEFLPWHFQKIIKQRGFSYDSDILKVRRNAYLDGYWQSEKYFADIEDIIREEFTFKYEPAKKNQTLLLEINRTNSVSLHIRRCDYITNIKTFQTHGALNLEYYNQSLKLIGEKIENPAVFVFSDDIQWAKKNLKSEFPLCFVDYNGANDDYEDLRLMSRCKHHIIANSSFSWWGAWLSPNQNKIVIAPRKWFSDEQMKVRQKIEIIPDGWVQI